MTTRNKASSSFVGFGPLARRPPRWSLRMPRLCRRWRFSGDSVIRPKTKPAAIKAMNINDPTAATVGVIISRRYRDQVVPVAL